MAYVRTVRTASGATAVQIVHSSRRGSRQIEHVGSTHDDAELAALKAAAAQRLAEGQLHLDLGLDLGSGVRAGSGSLEIASARMAHLWDALCRAYDALGFPEATGGDVVFRDLVLARIIEPTSKLDSLRVLSEVGLEPVSYATVKRHLPAYAKESWRHCLAAECVKHASLGPASLVLYDVSTLYFETDVGDGSVSRGSPRNAGSSRRSRSDCSLTRPDSRCWSRRSKATRPRPRRCCRPSPRSWPRTGCRVSPWSPTRAWSPR